MTRNTASLPATLRRQARDMLHLARLIPHLYRAPAAYAFSKRNG